MPSHPVPPPSAPAATLGTGNQPSPDWAAIRRPHPRPVTALVEGLMLVVSLTAIAGLLLIFVFVGREALPVLTGSHGHTLPAVAAEGGGTHPDAGVDPLAWRHLLLPRAWEGYPAPSYVWQPVSPIPKYNLVPLVAGSLKVTLVALALAVPFALASAIYVSRFAPPLLRTWIKPAIEWIASVPSVVIGVIAAGALASALQAAFGYTHRLNAFVAGIALGLATIPLVFSLAEEAISHVPEDYTRGAVALGASPWQTTLGIVLPAARPGITAAVMLGFGRCLGETLIVFLASGNAAVLSAGPFDPTRTLTATIAAELGETVVGGPHYQMLFVLGSLLLLLTLLTNGAAQQVLRRLRRTQETSP